MYCNRLRDKKKAFQQQLDEAAKVVNSFSTKGLTNEAEDHLHQLQEIQAQLDGFMEEVGLNCHCLVEILLTMIKKPCM